MMLFADLSLAPKPTPAPEPPIACSTCGSRDWWRCAPGTASTAEFYPASNIVAFRTDDGAPLIAYCTSCDPLVARS